MGIKIIKVPPHFAHPKDLDGVFIPGAHLESLHLLSPEQRTHFQYYETVSEGTPVSPIFPSRETLEHWFAEHENSRRLTSSAGTNMVRRSIPGTQEVKGREFMYIECREGETFHQIVDSAFDARSIARPKAGGAMEQKAQIKLKDGVSLRGISYKGDIEGWRAGFVGFCVATERKYGSIKQGRLFLSDGSSSLLEELEVTFET
jgi:hypothetical protein